MYKELIVVEGKNDANAVRRALGRVDILWTEGYGLTQEKLSLIAHAAVKQGVIVLTDPDSVGEQIRERIRKRVPEAKHAYLSKTLAIKNQDVGVENADPEEIRQALARLCHEKEPSCGEKYTMQDLIQFGLAGTPDAVVKRQTLGRRLGVGDANAKQLLSRLNRFNISKKDYSQALEELGYGKRA